MQRQFTGAKQDVANAVAEEKKLLSQLEREKQHARDWDQRAVLAVKQQRDDLAKEALRRQAEHSRAVTELERAWSTHRTATEAVKERLRDMNARLDELKRKKGLLVARQSSVQAQTRVQRTVAVLRDDRALATFERMEQKIVDMEAKASAAAELADDLSGVTLEEEFRALEAGGSEEQRLAELKRKLAASES